MKLPPASTKASRSLKEPSLSRWPMKLFHDSPIDMPPRHSGETRTPAVLERTLYRPNSVGGSGAGVKRLSRGSLDIVNLIWLWKNVS